MKRKRILFIGLALVVAAIAGGAVAAAAGDSTAPVPAATQTADDDGASDHAEDESHDADDAAEGPDQPITGPDLERASQAALDYLGEGRVTETEIEDEESYYEVEVTLDNGKQIDVQLDEEFNVVGTD